MDLFDHNENTNENTVGQPLADILRPSSLDELVGQGHLIGDNKILTSLMKQDVLPSLIFWGPPGSGKTTLARIIARTSKMYFCEFSAVVSGIADIKRVVQESRERKKLYGQQTVVFIDEIHRFNKSQQDAFLPHVESGAFTLIGATTENPSFSIVSALLSRSRVFILKPLSEDDLKSVLTRAIDYYFEKGLSISVDDSAVKTLIHYSDGDARRLLTALETVIAGSEISDGGIQLSIDTIRQALQHKHLFYDRSGEEHYNLISALHKSVRDSDPNGTIYWLGRMLEAGEDPMYIARRLVRISAEDIGLADPSALPLAQSALMAVEKIGMPESNVILAEAAIYLALAPKSNAVYVAYKEVQKDVEQTINEPVPLHLRNASTEFMESIGYGKGYKYAHDAKDARVDQEHLPQSLQGKKYYRPTNRGWEKNR